MILMKRIAASGVVITAAMAMGTAIAHEPAKTPMKGMHDAAMMPAMGDMHGMKMTGDQDYDFATMMREHHKMALTMASKEMKEGKNADMRRMAKNIVDAQTKEIAQFDAWIGAHKPVMSAMPGMAGMSDMSAPPTWKPFSDLDKNHDGFLTHKELPASEMLDQHFSTADTNHDGKLSAVEVAKHRSEMAAQGK